MKFMYRTGYGGIGKYEVIKISGKSIWFKNKGRDRIKREDYYFEDRQLLETIGHKWHETHEQAKSHLIKNATEEVRKYEWNLNKSEQDLTELLESLK